MKEHATSLFFLGKGGVGKSTSAALFAVYLSRQGKKVLLTSLDPAHNQSDIFGTGLSETPKQITGNLLIKEVDINIWVEKYLSDVQNQIKRTYSYLTAFNLESYFGIIKYSPGIEEYALLSAYKKITEEYAESDFIIFDMPPTALTLKFFCLPKLSLTWLNKLQELRNEIIKKREIITRIKFGNKEIERDKILNKLESQINSYRTVEEDFRNSTKTKINLVLNPDKLSFSESKLISEKLKECGLEISEVILNKYKPGFSTEKIKQNFASAGLKLLPLSEEELLGTQVLTNYIENVFPR